MEIDQIWNEVQKLRGRTLKTLDRQKPFIVAAVTYNTVTVIPQSTGKERPISREGLENAFRHLMVTGRLTLAEIEKDYAPRNLVYVAAILAEMPGITYKFRPIRLYRS